VKATQKLQDHLRKILPVQQAVYIHIHVYNLQFGLSLSCPNANIKASILHVKHLTEHVKNHDFQSEQENMVLFFKAEMISTNMYLSLTHTHAYRPISSLKFSLSLIRLQCDDNRCYSAQSHV
jgi:hypothetical protein